MWGFILAIVGCFFWVIFSAIVGVTEGLGGDTGLMGNFLVYLFGSLFFFSIPVTSVIEGVKWFKHRNMKKSESSLKHPSLDEGINKYCIVCGTELTWLEKISKSYCPTCDKIV